MCTGEGSQMLYSQYDATTSVDQTEQIFTRYSMIVLPKLSMKESDIFKINDDDDDIITNIFVHNGKQAAVFISTT